MILILLVISFFSYKRNRIDNISFESNIWINENKIIRGNMLDDLLSKNIINNLNLDQIKEILGEPDQIVTYHEENLDFFDIRYYLEQKYNDDLYLSTLFSIRFDNENSIYLSHSIGLLK